MPRGLADCTTLTNHPSVRFLSVMLSDLPLSAEPDLTFGAISVRFLFVLLLVLLNIGLLFFVRRNSGEHLAQSVSIVFAELAYILPVVIILYIDGNLPLMGGGLGLSRSQDLGGWFSSPPRP